MRVNIDGEHYLLLRSSFWAETSDVIGIDDSAERAQEAARDMAAHRPDPIGGFSRRGAAASCAAASSSDVVRAARWWLYCGGAVEKWGLR